MILNNIDYFQHYTTHTNVLIKPYKTILNDEHLRHLADLGQDTMT